MAYEIVKRLIEQNEEEILNQLSQDVSKREQKEVNFTRYSKNHLIGRECLNDKFIDQKLDYMHDNPRQGVWNLAESPMDYIHSSAKFYLTGEHSVYPVTHCDKLKGILI